MTELDLICMIPVICVVVICCFAFIANKPYYSVVAYYAGVFIRRQILPHAQVRVQVVVNLALLVFLISASIYGNRRRKALPAIEIPCFKELCIIQLAVIPLECIIGIVNGYSSFQILVDVYKVLEIVIWFVFIQLTWRSRWEADSAIKALVYEMCILGLVEIFITERGGTGLNIIMSVMPLILALGFEKYINYYWIIITISLVTIILSETRTYILGMLVGILIIGCLGKGALKKSIVQKGIVLIITVVIIVIFFATFTQNNRIMEVVNRFAELFGEGFEGAGGYRIYEIRIALSKFFESPLFGKGYGYLEYLYIQQMGYFRWGDFMHNTYVEILCKTGIYGSIVYMVGIVQYIKKQADLIRNSEQNQWYEVTGILIGGIGGTVSWLVVYFAAPLSTYSSVFIPGIISLTYYALYQRERLLAVYEGSVEFG